MDNEKIVRLSVTKLFNQFSYDINLQNENNISILIGPNGTGKTTIMDFLSFIFVPSAQALKKLLTVPFERFSFELSNGWTFTYKKASNADEEAILPSKVVVVAIIEGVEKTIDFEMVAADNKQQVINFDRNAVAHDVDRPYNERAYMHSQALISEDEVDYERLARILAEEIAKVTRKILPDMDSFQFIRANRFEQRIASEDRHLPPARRRSRETLSPLERIDRGFKEICFDHTREYHNRLQYASGMLPQLYLSEDAIEEMSYEEFNVRLKAYQSKIEQYAELGLIDDSNKPQKNIHVFRDTLKKTGPINLRVNSTIFESKKDFLITYLKTFEATIGFFDTTYEKLRLFIDIFNKRNEITKKTMRCTPDGLVIDVNGSQLSIYDLSSGEKNDIIMFYELIFGNGNIVFIDEPEISLHIEWQSDFINQLLNICNNNDIQVIIATHSPYIVYGHNDLIADKKVIEK